MHRKTAASAILEYVAAEAALVRPWLIVEIGAGREQLSTVVLSWIAEYFNADHIAVDMLPAPRLTEYERTRYVCSEGIEFAAEFEEFRRLNKLPCFVDLFYLDTSELYDEVCGEIDAWLPHLGGNGAMMFRCTNLQKQLIYQDGSSALDGWDNQRGVIRALEDKFQIRFDETKEYEGEQAGWKIKHWPYGAGLTVLHRRR